MAILPRDFLASCFPKTSFREFLFKNLSISFQDSFFNYSLYLELLARHIADAMKQRFGRQCSPYGRLCLVIEV
ncbi:hypothetical protein, partial [Limnothrix sp. PR1529]|uniref:hypothetical protein n=1 Tax=Limnothrix sp. PR1529 TaxID=1704291 RepID=UPI001F21FADE